ncbi:MAG: hypothetical protein KKE55_01125 [Candidatus Omnitrophica bacterium]|nr:hypothetical protein [Candidatus Omnitrophota bacterium]
MDYPCLYFMRRYSLFFLIFFTGCASFLNTQNVVEIAISHGDLRRAQQVLSKNYGKNNELLYLLDKGYVLHLAGDYSQSIEVLSRARRVFDDLYTKSLSKTAASFVFNDYTRDYAGEDYERAMINVFQAINYAALNKWEDALVEARDADSFFKAVSSQYAIGKNDVYDNDAFVRFFMGIVYEAGATSQDINDAYVSYRQALELYKHGYYGIKTPDALKRNLLTLSQEIDPSEFRRLKAEFSGNYFMPLKEKAHKAQLYLVQYNGLAPVKQESFLIVPVPGDQRVIKVAVPKYVTRFVPDGGFKLSAVGANGKTFSDFSETAEDIVALATQALEKHKAAFIVKTLGRNAARYAAEEKASDKINKQYGDNVALAFDVMTGIFSVLVEKADLRCSRLMPAEVRVAALILEPGEYEISFETTASSYKAQTQKFLGKISLKAGETRFLTVATY